MEKLFSVTVKAIFSSSVRKLLETLAYHVSFAFDTMTEKETGEANTDTDIQLKHNEA